MIDNKHTINNYAIDTSKLEVGQFFNNTKSMCEYLNQPYITGSKTSRESQLKEWKRYINWETVGRKIVITEIHSPPLDKVDGRVANGNQKYQRFVEDILFSYMVNETNQTNFVNQSDDFQFLFTLNGIALICRMINDKYVCKDIFTLLENKGYTPFNIKDFFSRTELKFSLIINNALKSMEKRKLINYNKILIINEKGKQRTASVQDENDFSDMEKLTLAMMSFENVGQVFLYNKAKEYYFLLDKNVKKHLGWDGCYKMFGINLNSCSVDVEECLTESIRANKEELNENLIKFFNTQASNKFIKSCKDKLNGFKLPADYKKQQYALSDYLLKIEEYSKNT